MNRLAPVFAAVLAVLVAACAGPVLLIDGDGLGGGSSSGLDVTILPGLTPAETKVVARGEDDAEADDTLRAAFGLTLDAMKAGLKLAEAKNNNAGDGSNYQYAWCPGASETNGIGPWNDLHLPESAAVTLTTVVLSVGKVTVSTAPEIVARADMRNPPDAESASEITQTVSDKVTRTIESTWSHEHSIGESEAIKTEVGAFGTEAEAETTISLTDTWGKGGSESKSVEVGSESSITKILEPGQCAVAAITASKGTLSVPVTYQASIRGSCVGLGDGHHHGTHVRHHIQQEPVTDVLSLQGLPTQVTAVQTVTADFYADTKIEAYPVDCNATDEEIESVVLHGCCENQQAVSLTGSADIRIGG